MKYIHPHNRFSHHVHKNNISTDVINQAVYQFDPSFKHFNLTCLNGGFMNANFLIENKHQKLVFRFYSSKDETAEREQGILTFLEKKEIKSPKHYALMKIDHMFVAVLEYIDGINFENKLLESNSCPPQLYYEIGCELAKIHSITFSRQGFMGKEMMVGHEYDDFAVFLKGFIFKTIKMLETKPDRIDQTTLARLVRLMEQHWCIVEECKFINQLVHTDFNPKNLLVSNDSEPHLLAVIDWEFALSGNGVIDLGNFFRFSYDYETKSDELFEQGYRSINQALPSNWREVSRLFDIANMCSFLERPENYQKSFSTARNVLQSTLDHFKIV